MAIILNDYHPTDCAAALDYNQNECPRTESGGIRHILMVHKGYNEQLLADLRAEVADPVQQNAIWLAAQAAGHVIAIPNVLGDYDGGSPTETQGYGGTQTRTTGMEHTVTIDDVNVVGNHAFAKALMGNSNYVLWFASSSLLWCSFAPAGASVSMPIEREYTSEVKRVYTFKWSSLNPPEEFALPAFLTAPPVFHPEAALTSINQAGANVAAVFSLTSDLPCAGGGAATLAGVTYDPGTGPVASAGWTLTGTPVTVAPAATTTTLNVGGPSTPLAAGVYQFTFMVTGCGQGSPSLATVVVII